MTPANSLLRCKAGTTAVEYALILMLVSTVIIGAMRLLGTQLDIYFTLIKNDLSR